MSSPTFELDSSAEAEFYETVAYYKQFETTLYQDFIQDFDNTVQNLVSFPNAGQPYLLKTKRIFLRRFPFSIVYKIYKDELIVAFAIMHMRRKPDYWATRIK